MDFSHAYFNGGQSYQFMGIPPLTPSHSNSAASEEFSQNNNHSQSPHEIYEPFPPNHEQFPQNFDQYAQFNNHNQPFPGPPGPPTPPNISLHGQNHTGSNGTPQVKNGQTDILPLTKPDPDTSRQTGSNSDEDDLSPAQSRRKAQNRAAQRAFRERKERHVKDLEAKLATLEAAQNHTATENEKLRREMQKMNTENEILRATSSVHAQHNGSMSPIGGITAGPMQYNPTDFYSDLLQNHANKTPSHRIVESGGERLLAAGATWDYIINHDLFKKGLVDVADVSERLKCQAKCDGQGPVFEERAVLKAIMDSVASGSDELL